MNLKNKSEYIRRISFESHKHTCTGTPLKCGFSIFIAEVYINNTVSNQQIDDSPIAYIIKSMYSFIWNYINFSLWQPLSDAQHIIGFPSFTDCSKFLIDAPCFISKSATSEFPEVTASKSAVFSALSRTSMAAPAVISASATFIWSNSNFFSSKFKFLSIYLKWKRFL